MLHAPRVLHVSLSDTDGGAALAAFRLHRGLLKLRVDSKLVVIRKRSADPTVAAPLGRFGEHRVRAAQALANATARLQVDGNAVLHSLNWCASGLGRWLARQPDCVVHLHWVGGETLSLREIGSLRQPVFWTLHDMWPFCGAEHYESPTAHCRYSAGYSRESRSPAAHGPDLDRWTFNRKLVEWRSQVFHLACPSNWMRRRAATSDLFGRMRLETIPNGLDIDVFRPLERAAARRALGLPAEGRILLYGAVASTADPRKGFDLLVAAMHQLPRAANPRESIALMVFGSEETGSSAARESGLPIHYVGSVRDERRLALIYAAADVFVAPSRQDNLPNTLLEALSCGVPCAAFRVGGIPEIIIDGRTGFLAEPFSAGDLATAISKAMQLNAQEARAAARHHAVTRYSDTVVAERYLDYYRSIDSRRGLRL